MKTIIQAAILLAALASLPAVAKDKLFVIGLGGGHSADGLLEQGCGDWNTQHSDAQSECVFVTPPSFAPEAQQIMLQDVLQQTPRAIAILPIEPRVVTGVIEGQRVDAPIVVLGTDLPADDADLRAAFVGTDFQALGAGIADALLEKVRERSSFSSAGFCLRVGDNPVLGEVAAGFRGKWAEVIANQQSTLTELGTCPIFAGLPSTAASPPDAAAFGTPDPVAAVVLDPEALTSQTFKDNFRSNSLNANSFPVFGFGSGPAFPELIQQGFVTQQFGPDFRGMGLRAAETLEALVEGQTVTSPVLVDFLELPQQQEQTANHGGGGTAVVAAAPAAPIALPSFMQATPIGTLTIEGQDEATFQQSNIAGNLGLPPAAWRLIFGGDYQRLTMDNVDVASLELLDFPSQEPAIIVRAPGRGGTEYVVPGSGVNGGGPVVTVRTPATVRVAGQYTSLNFTAKPAGTTTTASIAYTKQGWPMVTPGNPAYTPPYTPTPDLGDDGIYPRGEWPEVLADEGFLASLDATVSDGKYTVPFFRAGFPDVVLLRTAPVGNDPAGICSGTLIGKSISPTSHILTAHHCSSNFFAGGGQAFLLSNEAAACLQGADMAGDFVTACALQPLEITTIDRLKIIDDPDDSKDDGLALLGVNLKGEVDPLRPRADIGAIYGATAPLVTFTGFGYSSALAHESPGSLQVTWGKITVPNGASLADAKDGIFGVGRLTGNYATACGGDSGGGIMLGRLFGYSDELGIEQHELAGMVLRGTDPSNCLASAADTEHVTTTAISLHSPPVLEWLCGATENDLSICDRRREPGK